MFDFIFLNKKIVSKRSAKISITNSGFMYGDGIFETLKSKRGRILFLPEHLSRFFSTARALRFETGLDRDYIEEAIKRTLKANMLVKCDAYIKIILARGRYKERLDIYSSEKPDLIIMATKIKDPKKKNYSLVSSTIKRDPFSNELYRYKLLNYFENIFAKNQALRLGADEAIFLTKDRYVLECSTSNIFCVRKRRILTPPLNLNILPGITRQAVIKIAKDQKIRVSERKLHYSDLISSEEIFITNSLLGIMPVSRIDIHDIPEKREDNLTLELTSYYDELIDKSPVSLQ